MALTQHLGRSGCSLTVKACCATQELKKEAGGARAKEMAELARFKSELRMLEAGDQRFRCLLNGGVFRCYGTVKTVRRQSPSDLGTRLCLMSNQGVLEVAKPPPSTSRLRDQR